MLVLAEPSLSYKDAQVAAAREFKAAGEWEVDLDTVAANFEGLLTWIAAQKNAAAVEAGQLPYEDFWLMVLFKT